MKTLKALLAVGMVVAFATFAAAGTITINHSGGTWQGTVTNLSMDGNGSVTVDVAEDLGTGGGGGGGDTTPPSDPTNLQATAVSSSQINLTWNASSDNVGVVRYRVYRDGSPIGTTSSTSYSSTSLSASTQYCYTVRAEDQAGNNSNQSSQDCDTTQASSGGGGGGNSTNLGSRYPNVVDGTISGDGTNRYYLVTDSSASTVTINMLTADWYTNQDLIASNVRQPECSDIVGRGSNGTNGMWYGPVSTSNETINVRPGTTMPAGTKIYVTVCNKGSVVGKFKLYWTSY